MRILRLRLLNLNSLKGRVCIDFTQPQFAQNGLFAITGPTGAGKSTLLDAICLALYGQSSRFKSGEQIVNMMTRHTGECLAEVDYELGGHLYRSRWSQHRAGNKSTGKPQNAKMSLTDLTTDKTLEDKKSKTPQRNEEITGLDYKRFTRSVVLVQGEFAQFLKAKTNDRRILLERITGQEIYADLSIATHKKARYEKNALEKLEAQLSGIMLLSAGEKSQKNDELAKLGERAAYLKIQLDELHALLRTAGRLDDREAIQVDRKEEFTRTEARLAELKPQLAQSREQLAVAVKKHQIAQQKRNSSQPAIQHAIELQGKLSASRQQLTTIRRNLERARQQQQQHLREQSELEKQLAEKITEQAQLTAWFDAHPDAASPAAERDRYRREIDRWRKLETERAEIQGKIKTANAQLATSEKQLGEVATKQTKAQKALATARTDLTILEKQLDAFPDELDLRKQGETLRDELDKVREASRLATQLTETSKQLEQEREAQNKLRAELADRTERRDQAVQTLAICLKETRLAEEELQTAKTRAELSELRGELEAGKPCPLCGSIHHPDAGNHPTGNEILRRKEALRAAAEKEQTAREKKDAAELDHQDASSRRQSLVEKIETLQEQQNTVRQQLQACVEADRIEPAPSFWQKETERLQTELAANNDRYSKRQELQRKRETQQAELEKLRTRLQSIQQNFQRETDQLSQQQREQALRQNRSQAKSEEISRVRSELQQAPVFGEVASVERADAVLQQLDKLAATFSQKKSEQKDLQQTETATRAHLQQATQSLAIARREVETGQAEEKAQEKILADAQQAFLEACSGFEAERPDQEQARLDDLLEKRAQAREQAHQRVTQTSAQLSELTQQLAQLDETLKAEDAAIIQARTEHGRARTEFLAKYEATDLAKVRADLEDQAAQTQREIGDIQGQLSQDDRTRRQRRHLSKKIDGQRTVWQEWERLNQLIGSADGKKFSTYAQSLTLVQLVRRANVHLTQLNDRYRLRKVDGGDPLDLEIEDRIQANARRPVDSLSGGETFLVSLALALGLSELAGRGRRIGTLFIDEGFGSLDPESLDLALSTLENLRTEGRLVGIISHVESLKERIPLKIEVRKKAGGYSAVEVGK